MKSRVMLIYPPTGRYLREDRCQIPAGNDLMSPLLPPTDLLYLAAVAEREGRICRVEDYSRRAGPQAVSIAELRNFDPGYLVVTVTTPTINQDLEFCSAAKRAVPGMLIIAKGAHALRFDRNMLEQCPELDMIIRGEPELTFRDILFDRSREEILGLTWRGLDGGIRQNPDRPYNDRLDDLPFPARHLIDNHRYVRPDTGMPQAVIKVSRGCPHHCFYCLATPVSGATVRRRSPENIMAEIRECHGKYGIRDFLFWSDVFNTGREWVLSLCRAIQESGLGVRWAANSRAELLDGEVAAAMRRSGCTLVSIGLESGSPEMLSRMGKGLNLEQARKAVAILKEAGIPTIAYYQIGLPWETRETAEETMRSSLEMNTDYASFFVSAPLPGTRYYDYALQQGLFKEDEEYAFSGFEEAHFRPVVRGHFLGKAEIEKLRSQAVRRYLLRPGYILRSLKRVRSGREVMRYAAVAFSLMGGRTRG